MATDHADPLPLLTYRLRKIEGTLELKADKDDVAQIANDVRGLRKSFIGLMVTIASSSVLFAFTVLEILANTHK